MNVGSALGFPAALSSVKRTDVRTTSDESDAPRSAASTTQFAAFLSMIVSNNPKVRSDLLKQLPEDSAGLLDHLLAEGDVFAANAEDATSIFTTTPGAVAQLPSSALMTSALPFSGAPNALDAARYGLMIDTTRADVETTSVKPVSDSGSATAVQAKNKRVAKNYDYERRYQYSAARRGSFDHC